MLHLDYDAYGAQVSALKHFRGYAGAACVSLLRVESLGTSEEYLLAAAISGNTVLDAELTEKLLALPGRAEPLLRVDRARQADMVNDTQQASLDFAAVQIVMPESLKTELNRQRAVILSNIEIRNLQLFSAETEKLDAWADDQKVSLEREIKELDRRIKETRTKSKGAAMTTMRN